MDTTALQGDAQTVLSPTIAVESQGWRVSLSQDWDVLGPFPIHAREQHFLSPSFPLNLTEPVDLTATWPSSYVDGGSVGWTKAHSQEDGGLKVSFPDVRWQSLRATEGWATLQHHSILRTTLTVYPPARSAEKQHTLNPRLLVNLLQGSFFAIRPLLDAHSEGTEFIPEWHAGNIYTMGRAPPNTVDLPAAPSFNSPTTYEVFVSGDYEIRLFGDPRYIHEVGVPILSVTFTVEMEDVVKAPIPVVRDVSHDVVCDVVDGWAFGDAIGIGLRSLDGWWTVTSVRVIGDLSNSVELALVQETRIAPTQTRILPIKLTQAKRIDVDELEFILTAHSDSIVHAIHVTIPVQHHAQWSAAEIPSAGIKASYLYGTSIPTAFLVIPPKEPHNDTPHSPILALHGAGVDIFRYNFWIQALPRQRFSWVIAPTGRTEWGLDWHGPSAREAWATVDALRMILHNRDGWRGWSYPTESKVLLMGHSNGGQGAWYLAARYPDKIVGAVPAAGYIKSQSYVPWVQSRSAHYVDPSLRAILDSSLTPDDNDLFLSNLADKPILAIHGGDDENVPVWHTREAVSVVKTWNPHANVTLREDVGKTHWYQDIFTNQQVAEFLSSNLENVHNLATSPRRFTLTVAIPSESGSLYGWSIHSLHIPGRLGRLHVEISSDAIKIRTYNIRSFSIRLGSLPQETRNVPFLVNGQTFELDEASWGLPDFPLCLSEEAGVWISYPLFDIAAIQPSGRIANILNSVAPITVVISTRSPSLGLSAALRLAHNLNIYHKLDVDIIADEEAVRGLRDGSLGEGNIIVLGSGGLGSFAESLLSERRTPFSSQKASLELHGQLLDESSTATLFLHPHPTHVTSLVLFVHGADASGLERGLRLFPIRTGVTIPDWIIVGSRADDRGSGGAEGAGVWGNDWSWNEAMSAI